VINTVWISISDPVVFFRNPLRSGYRIMFDTDVLYRLGCGRLVVNLAIVSSQEHTLNSLVGAAFGAAGQRCMALSTVVFVGEAKEWIKDMKERAEKLVVNEGCAVCLRFVSAACAWFGRFIAVDGREVMALQQFFFSDFLIHYSADKGMRFLFFWQPTVISNTLRLVSLAQWISCLSKFKSFLITVIQPDRSGRYKIPNFMFLLFAANSRTWRLGHLYNVILLFVQINCFGSNQTAPYANDPDSQVLKAYLPIHCCCP